ncbi:MAG TPA: hypothetical protein IAB52_07315 [Candidatus Scatomonas merdavium]|nr:hypothetical protein [Candidatus Scatomonas merdavium]
MYYGIGGTPLQEAGRMKKLLRRNMGQFFHGVPTEQIPPFHMESGRVKYLM